MRLASCAERRAPAAIPIAPTVFVVDADASARAALTSLIRHDGWTPATFDALDAFPAQPLAPGPGCIVIDAAMPEIGVLALLRRVAAAHPALPVIVTTADHDVALAVRVMKAGAAEVLVKPLDTGAVRAALEQAIARSRAALDHARALEALRVRYAALSRRERQVMALVVSGRLNKQVGGALGISEITVKAHRGRVMRKMAATSLVDLVHMAMRLCLPGCEDRTYPNVNA